MNQPRAKQQDAARRTSCLLDPQHSQPQTQLFASPNPRYVTLREPRLTSAPDALTRRNPSDLPQPVPFMSSRRPLDRTSRHQQANPFPPTLAATHSATVPAPNQPIAMQSGLGCATDCGTARILIAHPASTLTTAAIGRPLELAVYTHRTGVKCLQISLAPRKHRVATRSTRSAQR